MYLHGGYLSRGSNGPTDPMAALDWRVPDNICLPAINGALQEMYRLAGSEAHPYFYIPDSGANESGLLLANDGTLSETEEQGFRGQIIDEATPQHKTAWDRIVDRTRQRHAYQPNSLPDWTRQRCHPQLIVGWNPSLPPAAAFAVALRETFPADPLNEILNELYYGPEDRTAAPIQPLIYPVDGGVLLAYPRNWAPGELSAAYQRTIHSPQDAPWGSKEWDIS